LDAVVTGIFTIAGVVVTGTIALLAAWIGYKTDRRRELRRERRELYAKFQQATAQFWDALGPILPVDGREEKPSEDAVRSPAKLGSPGRRPGWKCPSQQATRCGG